jgi:Conserved domain frequently associated with peptide methionine sulfoxide reductase
MFNEGTERLFSSDLLKEDKKGFLSLWLFGVLKYSLHQLNFDNGTGWPSFFKGITWRPLKQK